jgi:hypothetical protein
MQFLGDVIVPRQPLKITHQGLAILLDEHLAGNRVAAAEAPDKALIRRLGSGSGGASPVLARRRRERSVCRETHRRAHRGRHPYNALRYGLFSDPKPTEIIPAMTHNHPAFTFQSCGI